MKITSRLAKDADPQKIADIRGPVALTIGRAFWIAVGLLAAVLLALVIWLIRRRRPATEAAAVGPHARRTPRPRRAPPWPHSWLRACSRAATTVAST